MEQEKSGDNWRNPDGTLKEGHPGMGGRPPGSLSITALVKAELEKVPEGQQISYAQAFLKKILHKAIIEGDHATQKMIWNYIDGLPKGSLDLTSGGNPIPIYGGFSIQRHDSDSQNIPAPKED